MIRFCLFVLMFCAPLAVQAQGCAVAPPDWVNRAERFVWGQVCAGQVADLRLTAGVDDGAGCAAMRAQEGWPQARVIRARLLREMVTSAEYVQALPRPVVALRCARVDGRLDLSETTLDVALGLRRSRMPEGLDLTRADLSRGLALDGSDLGAARLAAPGLRLGGDLSLVGTVAASMDLNHAQIGGSLVATSARVAGVIAADRIAIGSDLLLDAGAQIGTLSLLRARIGGTLDASGARFSGQFDADGTEIGLDLLMRHGGVYQRVDLLGVKVARRLSVSGSRFEGLLNADRIEVGESAFFREGAEFQRVDLLGARIGGQLSASGAVFHGLLNADLMELGDSLFLRDTVLKDGADLTGAVIGGSVRARGMQVPGQFDAARAQVGGDFVLGAGSEVAQLDMPAAQIGGDVLLGAAQIAERADLTDAAMNALVLRVGEADPIWTGEARLILRNAQATSLLSRMPESWTRADGTRLPVDLSGFAYARLGGAWRDGGFHPGQIHAPVLIDWIEGARPEGLGYVPQPFRQLETVLEELGAEMAAARVAYARHLHRMETRQGQPFVSLGEWLWMAVVGFGVYPFRLLWWFGALVLAGAVIARRSIMLRDESLTDCFWYSLENAIPLMDPHPRHGEITHVRPLTRSFFHFQRIAGFVLATILVGALTVLGE